MKNGRTQLVAILLAMIIALGCGVGGGIAALKIVSSDTAAGRFLAETLDIDVNKRGSGTETAEKPRFPI